MAHRPRGWIVGRLMAAAVVALDLTGCASKLPLGAQSGTARHSFLD
jgi:hypothetical protein